MALYWKLVIDCGDPNVLADFWAAALEYLVEDPSALIAQLRAAGQLPDAAVVDYGGGQRFAGLAAIRHPEDPFDELSDVGHGRRLLFQEVPEKKIVKNRLHIDVHGGDGSPESLETLVERLERLGAERVKLVDQGPAGRWWVMHDPEGNEFCAA
ncbi:glyoxalase/bleomycin resistance/dioxygenase family protein [Leucobacter coleopterorum]|uniref:Glyoxalase/bleomycin resistance/dioxygenase family protein n=1 Tax=Leucobacter coleopterorum TaxID=2714933 RepID=A0ABX6JUP2_9MICO|nr:VOC family protein [Leucobacter coleopterorum]QIM17995.1 glyoxalase/bleomycin resistance/dioxygenase family protein [Leucobacter coleopterorum]